MKVVLVDDQHLVREGLASLLDKEKGLDVVGKLASGEEALRFIHANPVDVMIIDAHMPGMAGMEATRRALKVYRRLSVIILVDDVNDVAPSRLTRTGARGIVTKSSAPTELLTAIEAAQSGERYIASDLAKTMALSMFDEKEKDPLATLSDREMEVLVKVAQGQTAQSISKDLSLSAKTVSTYRYRLYEKLGVGNDVELAHIAIENGLIHPKLPKTC